MKNLVILSKDKSLSDILIDNTETLNEQTGEVQYPSEIYS